ncbi:MAG TPA: HAMP domain-containing sensor histidine kinase [Candidatus Saccharimonadales bacterium]|nr:HAMP domain-containing sensor histidine kinase [Candidatus Saccharimonadales bacterium]
MFRSATFKLTLWYLAIITAISLCFSVVIYHFATGELQVGLHHQTLRIYRNFPVFSGNPLLGNDPDVAAGSHHILWQLIYFNILVVVAAGIASYFLARRTLRPIEQAHARQKRFTADVSHELRTPLTSLKMTSEVALMDSNASKQELRDALQSNLDEAGNMSVLINNLLRLTRLDDAQTQATFAVHSSDPLITDVLKQLDRPIAAKQLTVTPPVQNVDLYGDRDSLVQLLVILLDNAIKYGPAGSAVTMTAASNAGRSSISITDQGPGIGKEALPHVFDRFYREDIARTNGATGGYGLGLSIAKLICDRHHGHITLTSRPGHGTTATVELPAGPPVEA